MASCSPPSAAPEKPGQEPSKALLDKLDGLLKDCTPQEVESTGYGDYYTKGLDELKRVNMCDAQVCVHLK